MSQRPWWLWLASASFLAYFLFLNASAYYGREPFGFTFRVDNRGVVLETTQPGRPVAMAGGQTDDRIVSIDNLPVRDGFDLMVARANVAAGAPVPFRIERNGETLDLVMRPLARRFGPPDAIFPIFLVPLTVSLALGLLVAWRGEPNTASRLGAWLLASIGCVFLPLWPNGMAEQWRGLPLPVEMLLWPAAISSTLVPVLLVVFCARGASPLLSWRSTLLLSLPGLLTVAYVAYYIVNVVYEPAFAIDLPLPRWFQVAGPAMYPAYGAAAALLLWLNLRRLRDVTERRRVSTLLAGAIVGGIGMVLLGAGVGASQMGLVFPGMEATAYTGALVFCVLPLAFAYATLRHRLFDLRVIVRLGLRYALARGAILALIPIAIAMLTIDVLRHGDQPLQAILAARGWSYAFAAAIVAIIYVKRAGWMTAIDRRFFREQYAAQQILRDVVQDVSTATDVAAAAAKVVGRINSALHPITVAVLTKPRSASTFQTLTALPATHSVPSLPAGSPITQIVRALGRPVTFGSGGLADVPDDQRRWLTASAIEVVVPIATDPSRDEALLALGPRRSEEPYSKEDLDLLAAIGTSLGLLMQRTPPAEMPTMAAQGGAPAQKIGHRYRIERPIGEGGMGVVYAAMDETLDRAVAIKVIKDQHLLGADGLSRFQREARTAASLSHPNIVTIHDYGVDEAGSPYLVMELLDGQSLRAAIRSEGRMPPARALPILAGLAAAVEAAHAKGVIHRDLKPENVFLIARSTHAKILDYGIAKAVTATTTHATTGGVLGTLPYMAPEQAAGGIASPAWDIWSLSVVAFEMLSGAHPFGGGLPVAPAIPIRTLAPDLDDRIAAAIDRALTLDPATRPQHAISAILHS